MLTFQNKTQKQKGKYGQSDQNSYIKKKKKKKKKKNTSFKVMSKRQ